jgi:exodeoxyribonuclease VII large subunit
LNDNTNAAGRDIFSVSRLNSEVRAVIEGSFPLLWVEGELSNLAVPRSGHLYFSLKDSHAQVRCALFRGKRQLLRFEPANGDQVLARVRVGFYEPRGEFQLIVEHLEPAGAGSAQRAFEALKAKLQQEGLFDAARKRPLPAFPRRLGVITSPSGAAIHDVIQVLRKRAPYLPVTIFPAQVQGDSAAAELLAALQRAIARSDCDVLLLTRGGGSAEDLAAFNDEALARAVAASPIPVVSAVGHEIDVTISDFAADRRAPTPSAAAELISPDTPAVLDRVEALAARLRRAMQRRHRQAGERLLGLRRRLQLASPRQRLRQQQQQLDSLDLRLARAMAARLTLRGGRLQAIERRLAQCSPQRRVLLLRQRFDSLPQRLLLAWRRHAQHQRQRLQGVVRELNAVSPLATLQRGYSVLRAGDGSQVVSRIDQVRPGDALEGLVSDGRLALRVESVSDDALATSAKVDD